MVVVTMDQHFVGDKIKKLRKENKDTLKSLAEKIDYDWSNLSKIERGVYGTSIDILKKIAEVYNVNPNYFFGDNYTESEVEILLEKDLTPDELKKKFNFIMPDGVPATEEEIETMVKYAMALRHMKQIEGS